MKKPVLLIIIFLIYTKAMAQVLPPDSLMLQIIEAPYWTKELSVGLNFNQGSFSDNWRGGGLNSVAFGGIVAGTANYLRQRLTFDNEIELLYGVVRNQGQEQRKMNDRIFLDSKVGYFLSENWGAFFSTNFISQFAPGYEFDGPERTLISDFLSPGYLTTGLGFEYKPNRSLIYGFHPSLLALPL